MNEVAYGIGFGAGWLVGNAIIIVPLIALIWYAIASGNRSKKKK
jgi:hypothetical protein